MGQIAVVENGHCMGMSAEMVSVGHSEVARTLDRMARFGTRTVPNRRDTLFRTRLLGVTPGFRRRPSHCGVDGGGIYLAYAYLRLLLAERRRLR